MLIDITLCRIQFWLFQNIFPTMECFIFTLAYANSISIQTMLNAQLGFQSLRLFIRQCTNWRLDQIMMEKVLSVNVLHILTVYVYLCLCYIVELFSTLSGILEVAHSKCKYVLSSSPSLHCSQCTSVNGNSSISCSKSSSSCKLTPLDRFGIR